jgi:hypothetical protein
VSSLASLALCLGPSVAFVAPVGPRTASRSSPLFSAGSRASAIRASQRWVGGCNGTGMHFMWALGWTMGAGMAAAYRVRVHTLHSRGTREHEHVDKGGRAPQTLS